MQPVSHLLVDVFMLKNFLSLSDFQIGLKNLVTVRSVKWESINDLCSAVDKRSLVLAVHSRVFFCLLLFDILGNTLIQVAFLKYIILKHLTYCMRVSFDK